MKLNYAFFAFLLAMILISSLSTIFYAHRNELLSVAVSTDQPNFFVISLPLVLRAEVNDRSSVLNQSTRILIYNFIKDNPGIQFRGICNSLNLSIGVAQYHLGLLTKAGLLSIFRDGRYKRYFKSNKFTKREMSIISLLRHQTVERIFSILLKRQRASHNELASKLSISSQALTWQINRLQKVGFLQRTKNGSKTVYFLDEANASTLKQCINFLKSEHCISCRKQER